MEKAIAPYRRPILVALLHDTLNAERFDSLGDVVEALKTRAARLHVPYDAALIAEALTAVQQTRPLVRDTRPPLVAPDRLVSEDPIVPRDRAKVIVVELWRREDERRRKWKGCD